MGCNCEPKKYSVSMGCCQPVLGPIEAYYTKFQIDKMLEEIESGITSGCCITPEEVDEKIDEAISGISPDLSDYYTKEEVDALIPEVPSLSGYATEQWVLDKHYITGVDLSDYALKSEIPTVPTSNTAFTNDAGYLTEHQSLSGYATEQWVEDKHYITGVDLSDYVTYESLPDLSVYATKQWVINQNFALNTELIQYITNLQNQIDSLKQQISGCCGSTGETITRWITMTGANDYTCSGTTKMTKEKEQTSTDGGNTWADTGNYRTGSTVLEQNSAACGYVPPIPSEFKYKLTLDDSSVVYGECDSTSAITRDEVSSYIDTLVELEVGDCVTELSDCEESTCGAFSYFRNLSSVTLSDSVTTIGNSVFWQCISLTSINIPTGVTKIDYATFDGCKSLPSITIPNSVTIIDDEAFYNCKSLTSVTIPDSVTTIGKWAFGYCASLKSITMPNSLTIISDLVFNGCTSLTSVTIPNSVTSIGKQAFYHCSGLTSIVIPDSVTTINSNAFAGCSGLTSVDIPSGVTSIDYGAFNNCTSLTSVTVNAVTPPTMVNNVFNYTNNCPIYVPAQSVDAYKAANGWTQYASRIRAMS